MEDNYVPYRCEIIQIKDISLDFGRGAFKLLIKSGKREFKYSGNETRINDLLDMMDLDYISQLKDKKVKILYLAEQPIALSNGKESLQGSYLLLKPDKEMPFDFPIAFSLLDTYLKEKKQNIPRA